MSFQFAFEGFNRDTGSNISPEAWSEHVDSVTGDGECTIADLGVHLPNKKVAMPHRSKLISRFSCGRRIAQFREVMRCHFHVRHEVN